MNTLPAPCARASTAQDLKDQEAPQAHAQEEAQEDAEGDALAAAGGPLGANPGHP